MVVSLAMFGSLLSAAAPASAAPEPDDSGGAKTQRPAVAKWDPDAKVPDLTIPGTGQTVKAFSDLHSSGPRALPGFENTHVMALDPGTTAAGKSIRKVDGATRADAAVPSPEEPEEEYYCQTIMGQSTGVREERDDLGDLHGVGQLTLQYTKTLYVAEVRCNIRLDYLAGVAGLIDRTAGYDGQTLSTGQPFQFTNWHQGVSTGGREIFGFDTDGARRGEVAFDLIMQAPAPLKWGSCTPGPGQRVLSCSGVGTNTLHVTLGFGVFNTGLNPPFVRYVALGDSYASGTGTGRYDVAGPAKCRRSFQSYPYQIGAMRVPSGTIINPISYACHGATIADIMIQGQTEAAPELKQLDYLSRKTTRMVTISIGGNDLDFSQMLKRCFLLTDCGTGSPNANLIDSTRLAQVTSNLTWLYNLILSRIRPDGVLVVLTYPKIFPPKNQWCDPSGNTGINQTEVGQIERAWEAGHLAIIDAVARVRDSRIRLVDMYDAFAGHDICDTERPYANGILAENLEDSFHPNTFGYAVYRQKIVEALRLRP